MYLSFRRLRAVPSKELPEVVRQGAPCYPVWVCADELGNTILVDTAAVPARFWDPKKKSWRECGTNTVKIVL